MMNDVSDTGLPKLAPRELEGHKGTYGRVLIVGGSRGMAGAPALAGRAALRSGAGLVTVAVPRGIQATVAGFEPSYTTLGLGAEREDGLLEGCFADVCRAAENCTAVALGPGLGADAGTAQLVYELYQTLKQPMIVDADALNALAKSMHRLESPGGPRILTPHPGEFRRMTGDYAADLSERVAQATALCRRGRGRRDSDRRDDRQQTIVVLKGHQTIVADGEQYAVNATGNPGMATGGTGDCLTGVIAALVGQGLSVFDAARLGVHVHGVAGDLAAERLGQVSLIASDVVDYLPAAFEELC